MMRVRSFAVWLSPQHLTSKAILTNERPAADRGRALLLSFSLLFGFGRLVDFHSASRAIPLRPQKIVFTAASAAWL